MNYGLNWIAILIIFKLKFMLGTNLKSKADALKYAIEFTAENGKSNYELFLPMKQKRF